MMHKGLKSIKLGSSTVTLKGQTCLSVTIPKIVAENLKIKKGDRIEFYINPELGENIILIKIIRK